ncbi:MAG: hypothetical protein IPK60_24245 [Sandaracinaceae bacterium]|nr:hypothetical protein [Sandaracinaceae bacterium]
MGVLLFCSLTAVVASRALGEDKAWTSFLFLLVLLGSVSSFLFPTDYRIDGEGIVVKHLLTTRLRLWKEVRRIEIGTKAALVSTMRIKSPLDRFRGLVIAFDFAPEVVRQDLARRASLLKPSADAD